MNNVRTDDLSVTVTTTRHPRNLLAYLRKQLKVRHEQPGIYLVEGERYPTQIIVTTELPREMNFWLANLRNDLTEEQLAQVITAAAGKPEADAYLHAITNANAEKLEELFMRRKEGVILTEKLDAYFTERYAPAIAKGKAEAVLIVLRARFKKIPKEVEKMILAMSDQVAIESWAAYAATCQSMEEFSVALKR